MAATTQPLLALSDVTVRVGRRTLLEKVSFTVTRGAYLAIVGPNGCGKTSLLRVLIGVLRPARGSVVWHGAGGPPRPGYVPQHEAMDPIHPFPALDVVAMAAGAGRVVGARVAASDRARSLAALDLVGMGAHAAQPFARLSAGQRQRVLIARALATQPDVLLLDEPASRLDPGAARGLEDLVDRLRRERGLTVVVVTHDLASIADRADQVVLLGGGSATAGPPRDVLQPESLARHYGIPFTVAQVGGRTLLVPRDH